MQNLNYFTPANDIGIWRCKKKNENNYCKTWWILSLNNPKEILVQTHFNTVLSQTTTSYCGNVRNHYAKYKVIWFSLYL